MRGLIVLLIALALSMIGTEGCGGSGPPPLPPAPNVAGAPSGTPCERAGVRLAALGCREAETPSGTPFAAVCERAAKDGRDFHPTCIESIQTCNEVEAAYRGELCR